MPTAPRPDRPADPDWERVEHRAGDRVLTSYVATPPGLEPDTAAPLLVMLHGCTQNAAGFAAAVALQRTAERHGVVVVYPEQDRAANPQGCWNWFQPAHQARGAGEPAAIAAAVRGLTAGTERFTVDPARVYVAGLSAGGAMASVMALTYPDLFAAAAVHSGLAYRSATGMGAAMQALTTGGPDPEAGARAAVEAMGPRARPVPTIVLHGTADRTVSPVNGEQVVRQSLAVARLAAPERCRAVFERPAERDTERSPGGLAATRRRWRDEAGALTHEYVEVDGLGHAWSGGTAGASFTDPRGPSASEAIWEFFEAV